MAGDYGERKKLKTAWMWSAQVYGFGLVTLLLAVGFVAFGLHGQWVADQYWRVTGAPCPSLTASAFQTQPIRPNQAFRMESVVFARAYGHSSCGELAANGGLEAQVVCEFTNPGVLAVTNQAGTTYFAPGIGRPATVAATNGAASCVMASNYKGD